MLEQETLWGTIEEKPVRLSFSLSFPCSLSAHNFLLCEFLARTEILGFWCFPWQEKLVATLIATPNEDTQFEDEVTKREKGKATLQVT